MTIFFNISSVHPWNDTRFYHRQAHSILNRGERVIHIGVENNQQPESQQANLEVRLLPYRKKKARWKNIYQLFQIINKERPASIMIHDPELLILYWWLKRKRVYKPLMIYDMHENVPKILSKKKLPHFIKWCYMKLERYLIQSCDGVVFAEETYKEDYTFLQVPYVDVYNFPKVDSKKEIRTPPDVFTMVYIGSISHVRGSMTMLHLAKDLHDIGQKFKLIIIGTGQAHFIREMSDFIKQQNLEGSVILEGAVDFKDAFPIIQTADLGLSFLAPIPNFIGGKTTKCFEYMAAGIPFITSDFIINDIIAEEQCAYQVNVENRQAILEQVLHVMNHPAEAKQKGENGQAAFRDRYNWEQEERKLHQLLNHLEEVRA
ncbi:glycosyltransferase family 4 protein [Listeria booriae]|uniref:Glycosyltransferase family 4 protein n=1 Tax=Listeria booriae TaxID=1552123 RepID=A0A842B465_9LIST|nr:glycosyltransferase [Listeria booriae]MBC1796722.1 glycosyltransferase family 4 protein [Listeria booriae]MBC1799985.1 glycosyltransferase family 4 protein [Listeria booriae]MBC2174849.1 glycosyltransferase family 4 protein [Listeria booriae]